MELFIIFTVLYLVAQAFSGNKNNSRSRSSSRDDYQSDYDRRVAAHLQDNFRRNGDINDNSR